MSRLSDLLARSRRPAVFTGRLTAAERDSAVAAISGATAGVRAGTSRRAFALEVVSALISEAGTITEAREIRRAAEAALAAVELAAAEERGGATIEITREE